MCFSFGFAIGVIKGDIHDVNVDGVFGGCGLISLCNVDGGVWCGMAKGDVHHGHTGGSCVMGCCVPKGGACPGCRERFRE